MQINPMHGCWSGPLKDALCCSLKNQSSKLLSARPVSLCRALVHESMHLAAGLLSCKLVNLRESCSVSFLGCGSPRKPLMKGKPGVKETDSALGAEIRQFQQLSAPTSVTVAGEKTGCQFDFFGLLRCPLRST